MKRQILFRGKKVDGSNEWVEGNLVIKNGVGSFIVTEANGCLDFHYEVIPESVGQCLGLLDKDKVKIWEGDAISENGSKPYIVVWQFHSVQWIMQSTDEGRGYRHMAYDYAQLNYKVTGNIHDNPELITV